MCFVGGPPRGGQANEPGGSVHRARYAPPRRTSDHRVGIGARPYVADHTRSCSDAYLMAAGTMRKCGAGVTDGAVWRVGLTSSRRSSYETHALCLQPPTSTITQPTTGCATCVPYASAATFYTTAVIIVPNGGERSVCVGLLATCSWAPTSSRERRLTRWQRHLL